MFIIVCIHRSNIIVDREHTPAMSSSLLSCRSDTILYTNDQRADDFDVAAVTGRSSRPGVVMSLFWGNNGVSGATGVGDVAALCL